MVATTTTLSFVKTLLVPAVISLVMFLFLTLVLVPVWRRYRNRYGQYLPLDSISERTSSLRHRILGRLASLGPLATFLGGSHVVFAHDAAADDIEDGEELDDVDEIWRAIESHVPSAHPDHAPRLSREYASLEEGFMDDSDEEPGSRLS